MEWSGVKTLLSAVNTLCIVTIEFFLTGEAMWLLYNFYRTGIRTFLRQVWNWINIIQTLVFFISLCAYITSMVQVSQAYVKNCLNIQLLSRMLDYVLQSYTCCDREEPSAGYHDETLALKMFSAVILE